MSTAPAPAARGTTATALARATLSGLTGLCRSIRWYVRELSGEAAYDRYVAAHERTCPDHEPLTRAQWWRARDDFRESTSHERCC